VIDPALFDNFMVSESMGEWIRENAVEVTAAPGGGVLGMVAGLPFQANRFVPDSYILLRNGEKLVAIVILAKDKERTQK
jgi:hypothetical protein